MGEYARRNSDACEVKIGTCESMYYLRADQRHLVTGIANSVNPNGSDALSLRFRFPWPNEDNILPGEFQDFERSIPAPGILAPAGIEHYSVQFVASAGYLASLPCPESSATLPGLTIHRNGFGGAVQLVQQKLLADGRLVPVCKCGGCDTAWRLEDAADIEALVVAFRAKGDQVQRQHAIGPYGQDGSIDGGATFYHKIADRILEGAGLTLQTVEG